MCREEVVSLLFSCCRSIQGPSTYWVCLFFFCSLIMFAASQAFQKTAGEFILYPNTLQYFWSSLTCWAGENGCKSSPGFIRSCRIFPQQFIVSVTTSPSQISPGQAFSPSLFLTFILSCCFVFAQFNFQDVGYTDYFFCLIFA